jgi:hypothetical protein
MPDVRPFPVHGSIRDVDREFLHRAKAEINPPYLLTVVEAFPGSPGRVIALREPPPFLCDFALVGETDSYEGFRLALYWALHPEFDHPAASLVIDQLRAIFGPTVKEIHDGPHFE